jgi:hypothetical protein
MTPFSMDEFLNETADEYGEDEFDYEFNKMMKCVCKTQMMPPPDHKKL